MNNNTLPGSAALLGGELHYKKSEKRFGSGYIFFDSIQVDAA